MPWWSNGKANLLLVPIFSAMDGTVLYSIMEECFLQSALMSIVMSFGVAVVLNVLPLVIAKFLHGAIYKTTKHGLTMFAVFVAGFLLVYGGTVYLRFAYSDMYEQENQSMTLENTVSEEKVENGTENVQEISEKRRKSISFPRRYEKQNDAGDIAFQTGRCGDGDPSAGADRSRGDL